MGAPRVFISELDWAPGHYQWECRTCGAVGNVTSRMIRDRVSATDCHTKEHCAAVLERHQRDYEELQDPDSAPAKKTWPTARERALAELERIAALPQRERLKDFILTQTYSHDSPAVPDPDSPSGFGDIPDGEYPAVVDREIDAYRAEVLREASAMLMDADPYGKTYEYGSSWHHAADYVHPDRPFEPDPYWLEEPFTP